MAERPRAVEKFSRRVESVVVLSIKLKWSWRCINLSFHVRACWMDLFLFCFRRESNVSASASKATDQKNEECKNVNELLAVSCIFIIFPENSNAIVASIYGALSEIISMTKINKISRGKVIVMNLDLF